MYEDLIKALRDFYALRGECDKRDCCAAQNLICNAADAIEALQADCNQARLDCAIAERNHMNTLERFLEAQERIDELQSELKPFQEAAAEYGIDAKTMLTLAKSQIATAEELQRVCKVADNYSQTILLQYDKITELTAERDALLKSFTVTSQPIKVIQPKGVVE